MALREVTLKRLWGRSGARCAKCNRELTRSAEGIDAILGEACHIRSPQAHGPRHEPSFPLDTLNEYENLILLCRLDHKLIDDRADIFTVADLLTMKRDHEEWVRRALMPPEGFTWVEEPELRTIHNGTELAGMLSGASVYGFGHDHPTSPEAAEAIKCFVGSARDWADISDGIGPEGQVDIAMDMQWQIEELQNLGYEVLAGHGRYLVLPHMEVKGFTLFVATAHQPAIGD